MKFASSISRLAVRLPIEALEARIAPALIPAVLEASAINGPNGFAVTNGVYDGLERELSDIGDFNGDGFDDLIFTATGVATAGDAAAYVVFGKGGEYPSLVDASALSVTEGFQILGLGHGAVWKVSGAGDVNGDGFDDIVIGSPQDPTNPNPSGTGAGAAYVIFGKDSGFANLTLTALNGTDGFKLSGVRSGDHAGYAVSGAGDVNGDGFGDVIVGAEYGNPVYASRGAAYVVFGKDTPFAANLELSALNGTNGFRLDGSTGRAGRSVSSAGDVNNDGFDDIIIGAPNAFNAPITSGAAYVFFGKGTPFAASQNLGALNGGDGFRVASNQFGSLGRSVSDAGDVNGDGFADVIISAEQGDGATAALVVFGKGTPFAASLNWPQLDGTNGFKITGNDLVSAGESVSAAGDLNADGFDDLIIGATFATPHGKDSGASYVIFGKGTAFGPTLSLATLDTSNGFKIYGAKKDAHLGDTVSAAGDVNGDGFDDIVVSSYIPKPFALDGTPYVIFGGPAPVDARQPATFFDASGDEIRLTLKGAGYARPSLQNGGFDNADLASLELFDTDATTALTVTVVSKTAPGTSIERIFTHDALQHMGSITLSPTVLLGDGVADAVTDLEVSGKLVKLVLGDLAANTFIKLGAGLPYDVPNDTKAPDSLNNRPDLTLRDVLGAGVRIEVLGDGAPAGVGGGGLSKVTVGSWAFPGFIRTTQSIGDFTVQNDDFLGVLEVDKFGVGAGTRANLGLLTIVNGGWASTGSEIEGDIKAFDAEAFLTGATLSAASLAKVTISVGAFGGTLILTDPNSTELSTFTVATNFTGTVESEAPIKNLKIKGDFMGSLQAPLIGAISAYSFLGTENAGQIETKIEATRGSLGTVTASAGVVQNYEIITDQAFKGFNVKLGKLTGDTVGLDNVKVQAASIGSINVSLTADSKSTGVDLIGIRNSSFVTTGTGELKATAGSIGNITVTLTGAPGGTGAIGIQNVDFDARVRANEFGTNPVSTINALGNLTVKVSGSGGASVGLTNVALQADTIGSAKVSVSRKGAAATAQGVDGVEFTSSGAIGALSFDGDVTLSQVTRLEVIAGGKVGAVSVKAVNASLGSLLDSAILAGQALDTAQATKAALANATLGAVTLSGSLTNTMLIAGGSIGAVKAGGAMTDSLLLAGARLGDDAVLLDDFTLGDGNESFQRAAAIASVTVKGALTRSSIVAGVASTDAIFGNADDAAASGDGISAIGAILLGAGSGEVLSAAATDHQFAIQAAAIKSLAVTGQPVVKTFIPSQYLEVATVGEDPEEVLVRLLT